MSSSWVAVKKKGKGTGIRRYERQDGSVVYQHWTDNGYSQNFSSFEGCAAAQAEFKLRRSQGRPAFLSAGAKMSRLLEEALEETNRRDSPNTYWEYRRYAETVLLPEFGNKSPAAVRPKALIELVKKLKAEGKSDSWVANCMKPLRKALNLAVEQDLIEINPFSQLSRGRIPSGASRREHYIPTVEEINLIIEKVYELPIEDAELKAAGALAVEVLLRTGDRAGECLGKKFGNVDFENAAIEIKNSWDKRGVLGPVKTEKSNRRVPITHDLVRKIAARKLEMGADENTFIFAKRKGESPIYQSTLRRRFWLPAVRAAGIEARFTLHDARHAIASGLADEGLSSADVAGLLGHSTTAVTEGVYIHAFSSGARESRIRAAMEAAQGVTAS